MRKHGIIAYGTEEDREKLAALAKAAGLRSGSLWLIKQIREQHKALTDG
jgi:hypothetical protein